MPIQTDYICDNPKCPRLVPMNQDNMIRVDWHHAPHPPVLVIFCTPTCSRDYIEAYIKAQNTPPQAPPTVPPPDPTTITIL